MYAEPILIGLDIGTSGVRTLALTPAGAYLAEGRSRFSTRYPGAGKAEQEPQDWWRASLEALRALTEALGDARTRIVGIGLTGQCPSFACLHPVHGPIGPGLIYQDNRAQAEAKDLIKRFGPEEIHRRTGQAPSAFYILPKLLWCKEQLSSWPPAGSVIVQPRDLVGWYLTKRIATDPTHAACTLAYDIRTQSWTTDWLQELGLAQLARPEILPCATVLGTLSQAAAEATGLPKDLPVVLGAADSLCAAYGAGATMPGLLCEVTGTSTCLHLSIEKPVAAYAVNTYPHVLPASWCAEVGLNTTGGALSWLARLFHAEPATLLNEAEYIEIGAAGLYFLPHLSGGERDNPGRRGGFIGLELGHSAAHMTRALLEGVAYALRQRVELLRASGCSVSELLSCGGPARSALWTQIKADILGIEVSAISPVDTTALGAALLAAHALNIVVPTLPLTKTSYKPIPEHAVAYEAGYARFCQLEESCALFS